MKVIKRGDGYVVLEDGNLVPTCHTYYLNDGYYLVRDGREIWNIPGEKWVEASKYLPMIGFCGMPTNYGTLDEITEKHAMELIESYRQEKLEKNKLIDSQLPQDHPLEHGGVFYQTPEEKEASLKKRFLEDKRAAEYEKYYGYLHTRDGVGD